MKRAIIFALALAAASAPAADMTLAVSLKPEHSQVAVPVEADVTQALGNPGATTAWQLVDARTKEALPCQVSSEPKRTLLRFIIPAKASAEPVTRQFRLTKASQPDPPAFKLEDLDKKCLQLTENNRPVLAYTYAMQLKDGVPEKYRRACYVHPIHDLDGVLLTDDFPKDHYHHRGLFWTWPNVKSPSMEKALDLWGLAGMGQRFHRALGREVGPVFARLGVSTGWYVGERKIVDETAWLTVFRADETGRAMDVDLTLEATKEPVTIGGREKKGYGGFTLRFAPRTETVLWTPNGKLPKDADHDHFPWADLSAKLAGGTGVSGAAIFDHAQNPGFPNTWCLRHYGVISPTYPGEGTHEIKPGQPLRLRYRVWIHRGDAQAGKVSAAYAAFAKPPEVKIQHAK
ncbi:MAG: PmoA family protein [Verrucomicrobia bacterium]|nr:PmoA family protein [Verrucomicrobiota bacterium]